MMKILGINGSIWGSKTNIALQNIHFSQDVDFTLVQLSDLKLSFSDGRDYREYEDDSTWLVEKILEADAILIGTPVFQASIPGILKNVFDLLPIDAIKDKVVGVIVTAGSPKHYLMAEYQLFPILKYMKTALIDKYVFIEGKDIVKDVIVEDDIHFRLRDLAQTMELETQQMKARYEALYDF